MYNLLRPPPFDSRDRGPGGSAAGRAVAASDRLLRPEHQRGAGARWSFLGNVGMFTEAGVEHYVQAPRSTLTRRTVPTVLSVAVHTSTFSRDARDRRHRLWRELEGDGRALPHRQPDLARTPTFDSIDVAGVSTVFKGTPPNVVVPLSGNMPNLSVSSGGPNLVAPSPRNVARPAAFADLGPLPEIPLVDGGQTARPPDRAPLVDAGQAPRPPDLAPDAGGIVRATLRRRSGPRCRSCGDGGGPGAAPDVFGAAAPLAPFAGDHPPGADPEYFSQGAFDFVQSLARRASASR